MEGGTGPEGSVQAETGGLEATETSGTRPEGSMRAWAEAPEAVEEETLDNFEQKVILCCAAGEPVVSQDNITRRIKTCDVEVNRNNIS